MTHLTRALDAAYPPPPGQWIQDLRAMGAGVGFVYVWPWKTYGPVLPGGPSPYVAAAEQTDGEIRAVPIIVPGGSPPAPPLFAATWPYLGQGWRGPLVYDDARGDGTPPAPWQAQATAESAAAGYRPGVYIQPELRSTFPGGLLFQAVPMASEPSSLPPGVAAWQYADDILVNGRRYDLSVVDLDQFFAGTPSPSPAPAPVPVPVPAPPAPAPPSTSYQVVRKIPAYPSALLAAERSGSNGWCLPATYRIYARAAGMLNVTWYQGPGDWINPADNQPVPPPAPLPVSFRHYLIRPGDTLEVIAQRLSGKSANWVTLYHLNQPEIVAWGGVRDLHVGALLTYPSTWTG